MRRGYYNRSQEHALNARGIQTASKELKSYKDDTKEKKRRMIKVLRNALLEDIPQLENGNLNVKVWDDDKITIEYHLDTRKSNYITIDDEISFNEIMLDIDDDEINDEIIDNMGDQAWEAVRHKGNWKTRDEFEEETNMNPLDYLSENHPDEYGEMQSDAFEVVMEYHEPTSEVYDEYYDKMHEAVEEKLNYFKTGLTFFFNIINTNIITKSTWCDTSIKKTYEKNSYSLV